MDVELKQLDLKLILNCTRCLFDFVGAFVWQ